jgi:leader peptidase (prepilin peptidase)/N-methyltransferase
MAAGSLLVLLTRRELVASVNRSTAVAAQASVAVDHAPAPQVTRGHWLVLAIVSGIVPAYVLHEVGWSPNAVPPLLLVVGLIQLAYCDVTRRLLPKTLVYWLSAVVIASGAAIAAVTGESGRLLWASFGALACFALFFVVNLMNPRWMAFGDVRLSLVFGFGLAWISPLALFQGFLYANLMAIVVGCALMAVRRADRRSAMPFGLYMTLGASLVLLLWS